MLTTGEIQRIKYELGFNVLTLGAEPYIGITQYFDQIAIPNLQAGAVTTSSTAVVASATPAPVTLTLASVTGISMFDRVIVDVDNFTERATVRAVSGLTISVALTLAHSGTYSVVVEGGESMVRDILAKLRNLQELIDNALSTAGLKSLDKGDVEFFGRTEGGTQLVSLERQRRNYRDELRNLLFGTGNVGGHGGAALY